MTSHVEHRIETAQVRRSPRYGVFLAAGAALGLIVALILTFAFDGTGDESRYTEVSYSLTQAFGFIALIFASVNIFGGFLVTQRMLAMYKKKQK